LIKQSFRVLIDRLLKKRKIRHLIDAISFEFLKVQHKKISKVFISLFFAKIEANHNKRVFKLPSKL